MFEVPFMLKISWNGNVSVIFYKQIAKQNIKSICRARNCASLIGIKYTKSLRDVEKCTRSINKLMVFAGIKPNTMRKTWFKLRAWKSKSFKYIVV